MGFVQGINNIAKEGWDYINNVAKKVSVEGLQNGWNTYIKQSPEELADIARQTMQRKNTILNNNPNLLDEVNKVMTSSNITDKEYSSAINNLKNNLSNNNIKEANSIAKTIEERFQDGSYIKMLQEAEGKTNTKKAFIDSLDSDTIKAISIEDTKEKIRNNKIASNFIEDGEGIANFVYKHNPKNIPKYFSKPNDPKTNRIRAGVAAGTYMGAMTTARLIHGGTPITNEYGERDIVGIPFI